MLATKILEQSSQLANQTVHSADLALQSTQRAANEALNDLAAAARRASRGTIRYIRDEPLTAVLIAAVVGGALVALAALLGSRRRH